MTGLALLPTAVACRVALVTNQTLKLPLLVFYPTSRCNSRCITCNWWMSTGATDLSVQEIASLVEELPALGTRRVALSGGEPLARPDLFDVVALFRRRGMRLELLTNGLLLSRWAREVVEAFDRLTVSLDGSTTQQYEATRGVAGLTALEEGISAVRMLKPRIRITARATLHAANFRELPQLITKAKALGLDGISFLSADVSSNAFGRTLPLATAGPQGWSPHARTDRRLELTAREVAEFGTVVARTLQDFAGDFASGFIAESPRKLRRLPRYYAALRGGAPFPRVECNAPWVSAVLEADGSVRPCFFHQPIGNIREKRLTEILRTDLPEFRRTLDVATNAVCQRCVCSLKVRMRGRPW